MHSARRRPALSVGTALCAAALLAVTACSDGHSDVRSTTAPGWATYGGDAANSNFTATQVRPDLTLRWTRASGSEIISPVTVTGDRDVTFTTLPKQGCNMFVLDQASGRKNYCKSFQPGIGGQTPAVDQFNQPYVGERGTFLAFSPTGSIRWRTEITGVPQSPKFAGPGAILAVTSLGEILLLDGQNGRALAPSLLLRPDVATDDPLFGYSDCASGGPQCVVSAPPAIDQHAERFFLTVRADTTAPAELRAFNFGADDGKRTITQAWTHALPGGAVGQPTLSADGATVYAFSRAGKLHALNAATGTQRWEYDLHGYGFATLAVSPDGLLIPTAGLGQPITALRDDGDRARQIWQRTDLRTASLSTITASGTLWTVVRDRTGNRLTLTELATADGHSQRSFDLPDAAGFATGVAVGAAGQLVVGTQNGNVYYFGKPD